MPYPPEGAFDEDIRLPSVRHDRLSTSTLSHDICSVQFFLLVSIFLEAASLLRSMNLPRHTCLSWGTDARDGCTILDRVTVPRK